MAEAKTTRTKRGASATKRAAAKPSRSAAASAKTSVSVVKDAGSKSGPRSSRPSWGKAQWLSLSVAVNVILAVGVFTLLSNPASYTDASTGYTISIPVGWARNDANDMFRAANVGGAGELFVFGQRQATAGFYDLPEDERNTTLGQVVDQIRGGTNQFIPNSLGLTDFQNEPQREQIDGVEVIRTTFAAKQGAGKQDVRGEHLLYISKGGGFYSAVAFAPSSDWDAISADAIQALNTFSAP